MSTVSKELRAQWFNGNALLDPLPSNYFIVNFEDSESNATDKQLYESIGFTLDDITPQHVKAFKQESGFDTEPVYVNIGGFSIPVAVKAEEKEGVKFEITLREDKTLTISKFIHSLQRRIVKDNGIYRYPQQVPFPKITVTIPDILHGSNKFLARYEFHSAYPSSIPPVLSSLDYGTNDGIEYSISFTAKHYSVEYGKDLIEELKRTPKSFSATPASLTKSNQNTTGSVSINTAQ